MHRFADWQGSSFYLNEQRKDERTMARVEEILRRRDAVLKRDSDCQHRAVETQVRDLQALRDLSRWYVHVDMDAFYAAVAMLDNPRFCYPPLGLFFLMP